MHVINADSPPHQLDVTLNILIEKRSGPKMGKFRQHEKPVKKKEQVSLNTTQEENPEFVSGNRGLRLYLVGGSG